MIFVTVGTHEQQFNRLVKAVDDLKRDGVIEEDVFIQTGYSTYEPKYCKSKKFLTYKEMEKLYKNSDIIITHGGPASFMKALQYKKIPIVVPRQVKFKEHVNNHQVDFCKSVYNRFSNILLVEDINTIRDLLLNYDSIFKKEKMPCSQNNLFFNKNFETLLKEVCHE